MKIIKVCALILVFMLPAYSYSGQIGTTAPAFRVLDVHGNEITLEQFQGKVVFLTFWAPWCIPCKEELPELDKLFKKFGNDRFVVIGIAMGSSAADISKFLQKVSVTFPVLLDTKNDISDAYRVSSLPVGFIISKDGVVRYKHMGFGSEFLPVYEKEITDLLKQ